MQGRRGKLVRGRGKASARKKTMPDSPPSVARGFRARGRRGQALQRRESVELEARQRNLDQQQRLTRILERVKQGAQVAMEPTAYFAFWSWQLGSAARIDVFMRDLVLALVAVEEQLTIHYVARGIGNNSTTSSSSTAAIASGTVTTCSSCSLASSPPRPCSRWAPAQSWTVASTSACQASRRTASPGTMAATPAVS